MLRDEMKLIDLRYSPEGQELRNELGIAEVNLIELIKYKFGFLAKYMGHGDLPCIEKSEYFEELIRRCISEEKIEVFFDYNIISCIDSDSSLKKFFVFTNKEDSSKTIYLVSDKEEIEEVTQADIKKKFESGMRTLSKSKQKEYTELLTGISGDEKTPFE